MNTHLPAAGSNAAGASWSGERSAVDKVGVYHQGARNQGPRFDSNLNLRDATTASASGGRNAPHQRQSKPFLSRRALADRNESGPTTCPTAASAAPTTMTSKNAGCVARMANQAKAR
ncbi:hypothetical protein BSF38_00406 [Paludisphaera borealis]|uniref:Uncharacterized protein n=1 Tax=Paludisphaera borealis TaxID=1387353 RepID=A0A1U7CJD6_9BACT|nr:hypothetical protein BSF38_00406 [Paludisphaera borealis]